jgi:hypothetical protein
VAHVTFFRPFADFPIWLWAAFIAFGVAMAILRRRALYRFVSVLVGSMAVVFVVAVVWTATR